MCWNFRGPQSQCRVSLAMIIAVIGVDKNVTPGATICVCPPLHHRCSAVRAAHKKKTHDRKFVAFDISTVVMFLLAHFGSSTASPHFNAGNDTLSIHVKSLAHDDECGVTFMIKTTERRLQRGWRGSKINLIFMILMILSGIWRGARARKMTTNYMSAEYGVNRWDFSDIMSYVNCWWRRCALRSAVQWDDDVVLRHTESSERAMMERGG